MTAAAGLLLYALTLTWLSPFALHRLTYGGISPRLGIAAWLTAVSATVVAWIAAISLLVIALVRSGSDSSAVTFCLRALGMPGHAGTPGRWGTVALIAVALSLTAIVGWRVARGVHQLRSRSHEHAESARILGAPSSRPGVVFVDAAQPTAYCVAGRPHAIVVTTAALGVLSPTSWMPYSPTNRHTSTDTTTESSRRCGPWPRACRTCLFLRTLPRPWPGCWRCVPTTRRCAAAELMHC